MPNKKEWLHTDSGVAWLSAALSTPQICLQKFKMKEDHVGPLKHLGHQHQALTVWNRSRFSFSIMGLAFAACWPPFSLFTLPIFFLHCICIYEPRIFR